MKTKLLPIALALSAPVALAQTIAPPTMTTVYGITLHQPLQIEECQRVLRSKMVEYTAAVPDSAPCFRREHIGQTAVPTDEVVHIQFPVKAWPAMANDNQVHAWLVHGRVERLWVWTHGLTFQDSDLSALRTKFGSPKTETARQGTNAFGANFSIASATWALPDGLSAVYVGADGDIKQGTFVVSSTLGDSTWNAHIRAITGSGTTL